MTEKLIVVVGADGYVGKSLADYLLAKKSCIPKTYKR